MIKSALNSAPSISPQGWYALHTRYQHEKVVAQILAHKQFDVYLPLYEAIHHWRDRNRRLSLPLFPCYLFIRGGLERQLDVLTTPGIIGWVGSGLPSAIPAGEMEAVRRVAERIDKVEPHPYLACGDRVRVRTGPLAGIEGVLIRKKGFIRLVLSVQILQSSAAVEVDVACIERVAGGNHAPKGSWSGPNMDWPVAQSAWTKLASSAMRSAG
jgi:transcription antitermination factor NusG